MAHSSSFTKGQVPVPCGLYKSEKPIHFKCMECGDFLCSSCKNVHEKIKMTERHNIIDIKDVGHFIPMINLTNIPCQDHSGQTCCLFCNSCQRVVCSTCIAKSHKSHELVEIEEAYDIKKEILSRKGENVKRKLEKSNIKQQKILELKDQKTSKLVKTRQTINENEQVLKAEVERLTKVLLQNLDQTDAKINKQFEKDEKELNRFRSETEVKIQVKDQLVTTTDGAEFFQKIEGMITSLDETTEPTNSTYATEFNVGEIQTTEVSVPLDKGKFGLSVIKEFTTELETIGTVLPYQGDKLLICSYLDEVLQYIEVTGETYRILSTVESILVNGMAILDEDILISTANSCKLQSYNITTNKLSVSPFDTSPLEPTAIHVTHDRKVIIGAVNYRIPQIWKQGCHHHGQKGEERSHI